MEVEIKEEEIEYSPRRFPCRSIDRGGLMWAIDRQIKIDYRTIVVG